MDIKKKLIYMSLFLGFTGFEFSVHAAPTQDIVFLTSIRADDEVTFNRIEFSIHNEFQESGYKIIIKHGANQYDLRKALHSPTSVAVFWLSHALASSEKRSVDGCPALQSENLIQDVLGFNVAPVFQSVHPNLRFLAVIGCNSKKIIDDLYSLYPVREQNPKLGIFTDGNSLIDGNQGLQRALQTSHAYLDSEETQNGYSSACPRWKGIKIHVKRSTELSSTQRFIPALRIENYQEKVLGVFPSLELPEREQEFDTYIPIEITPITSQALKIIAKLGTSNSPDGVSKMSSDVDVYGAVGRISLTGNWEREKASWSVFSLRGKPIGTSSHVYQYEDPSRADELRFYVQDYEPFDCQPMPALQKPPFPPKRRTSILQYIPFIHLCGRGGWACGQW